MVSLFQPGPVDPRSPLGRKQRGVKGSPLFAAEEGGVEPRDPNRDRLFADEEGGVEPQDDASKRRSKFGFSFAGGDNHIVDDAERARAGFVDGGGTKIAMGGETVFAPDDARSELQRARWAREAQTRGYQMQDEDRALKTRAAEQQFGVQAARQAAIERWEAATGIPYSEKTAAEFARRDAEDDEDEAITADLQDINADMEEEIRRDPENETAIRERYLREANNLLFVRTRRNPGTWARPQEALGQ